ncbi:MAG: RluA family pseudouridine synthase [Planctomycetes bacterium]|nr:RluA family pseudouridine synthase [Planctomycetota bacterium]
MLSSRVPPAFAGRSLLEYLAQRFRYHDEAAWRGFIETRRVTVDGRAARPSQLVARGALVSFEPPAAEPEIPRELPLVHEDASFLVVEKPAGLVCHADGAFQQNTFLRELERQLSAREQSYVLLRLAHRLDRETSGLLVVARDAETARSFERQFTGGLVEKRYLAVVRGAPTQDRFEVDLPIGFSTRSEIAIRRTASHEARDARDSRTSFEVLERRGDRSLVRCTPHTGRTHQIRVHLEAAGHPVVGDKLYGVPDERYLAWVHAVKAEAPFDAVTVFGAEHQLLHAAEIAFEHPRSGEALRFVARWPERFAPFASR